MMPASALIIPLYLQLKSLNLLDTRQGLVLLYIGSAAPFAMFLMRAFFETLPMPAIVARSGPPTGKFAERLAAFEKAKATLAR